MAGGPPNWPNLVARTQARGSSVNCWPQNFVTRPFRMKPVPLSADLESAVLPAVGSEIVTHRPPCSGQIQRWPAASKSMIDSAIAATREALDPWRGIGAGQRLKSLQAFGNQLKDHRDEIVDLLVEDIGKPIRYARGECDRALALIDAAAQQIDPGQDRSPTETGYRREPLGVITLIGPFNNPLAIPIGKIVPALLYSNAVIWKPAIPGTRVARKTAELFATATDRPELLQVLCGGERTARELMTSCDAVTLSGSLKNGLVGQEICEIGRAHV